MEIKKLNYFVMKENTKSLTINEELVYAAICSKSDFKTHISHLQISTISELTGITRAATISDCTGRLVKKGLVKKHATFRNRKKIVAYEVIQ